MNTDRKEFGKWWLWVLILVVLAVIVFSGLRYAGIVTGTVVEREVFEQSYQRTEGLKQQIATWEAQIAELEGKLLNPKLDEDTKTNINAQISAIRVRLDAARRQQ